MLFIACLLLLTALLSACVCVQVCVVVLLLLVLFSNLLSIVFNSSLTHTHMYKGYLCLCG